MTSATIVVTVVQESCIDHVVHWKTDAFPLQPLVQTACPAREQLELIGFEKNPAGMVLKAVTWISHVYSMEWSSHQEYRHT